MVNDKGDNYDRGCRTVGEREEREQDKRDNTNEIDKKGGWLVGV